MEQGTRKLMRNETMTTRNASDLNSKLKALRNNRRLHSIRAIVGFHDQVPQLCIARQILHHPPCHISSLAENLVAETSMLSNTRNQWDVGGAYCKPQPISFRWRASEKSA